MNELHRTPKVPSVISLRTDELAPLLSAWRKKNQDVAWSKLLRRALRKELAPLAGKRYAHLLLS